MNQLSELTGARKAAILLLTIDDRISREVLKGLEEREIQLIAREISNLKFVSEEAIQRVHEEFVNIVAKRTRTIIDGEDLFIKLLKETLGEEKAEGFLAQIQGRKGMPGEFLKTCDPRVLAYVLKGEHPQTIALVLSTIGARKAHEVLINLPEKLQWDVLMRIATLEKVDKKILEDVETVLREQLEAIGVVEGRELGGVEMVANILNQMDRSQETTLLGKIEEKDHDLAERIRRLMFTFDDLLKIDNRGIQILLKEISSEDLTIALKGASEQIKEKIFSNMSERARAMLKEDIEALGPIRVSEVEKAQQRIAMVAKKLESEGKIVVSRGNERFI
ncbi:MAG: flagellar motor switch protein FliG [Desulfobacterota bacterium]|nr:flagellar motor switch protein FliG [Thermodesulfobacteriota bacterium]MDW8002794.1 flagellar motor switch protein FliG [Deltaproteobacteria bacterium]